MKKNEKDKLEKVGVKYAALDDKGAIYILGVAEGMATQKELSKEAESNG